MIDERKLLDDIQEIVRRTPPEATDPRFDEVALSAFELQFERIDSYRRLCERRDATPPSVRSWRDVPMVPTTAFATTAFHVADARETFRSSGTRSERRSVHHHPYPDLYRAVIDASFPPACLPVAGRLPILSLVPSREVAPDSSLGFLVAHVLDRYGAEGSVYGVQERGVEIGACRSWLGARQRGAQPALVLATAFALADLLERIAKMNLHFRLPAGSVVFVTGGFKGRRREVSREELAANVATWLGVAPDRIVDEYGMTELTSSAYSQTLAGGPAERYVPPPWMKVRVLDPVSLSERPEGEMGLLAFFDLANVGSALHVLTEDLGRRDGDGFRLEGRAPEADLRGCSLLAEELAEG